MIEPDDAVPLILAAVAGGHPDRGFVRVRLAPRPQGYRERLAPPVGVVEVRHAGHRLRPLVEHLATLEGPADVAVGLYESRGPQSAALVAVPCLAVCAETPAAARRLAAHRPLPAVVIADKARRWALWPLRHGGLSVEQARLAGRLLAQKTRTAPVEPGGLVPLPRSDGPVCTRLELAAFDSPMVLGPALPAAA